MNEVILGFDCQNSYLLETNFKLYVSSMLKQILKTVEEAEAETVFLTSGTKSNAMQCEGSINILTQPTVARSKVLF